MPPIEIDGKQKQVPVGLKNSSDNDLDTRTSPQQAVQVKF